MCLVMNLIGVIHVDEDAVQAQACVCVRVVRASVYCMRACCVCVLQRMRCVAWAGLLWSARVQLPHTCKHLYLNRNNLWYFFMVNIIRRT